MFVAYGINTSSHKAKDLIAAKLKGCVPNAGKLIYNCLIIIYICARRTSYSVHVSAFSCVQIVIPV
jgi:hypothetical protein